MNNRELLVTIFHQDQNARIKAIDGAGDEGLKARFRHAIKQAKNHWMATDRDDQLYMAIAAVQLTYIEEEKHNVSERIRAEVKTLQRLSAMTQLGTWIDLDIPENPIGIMALWGEK